MNQKEIKILAIETSCDETAAAVISCRNDQPVVLSNIISSQVDLHAKTGGVVPEVASRAHIESIIPVIVKALQQSSSNTKILNSKQTQTSNSEIQNCLEIENLDLNIVSDLGFSYSDLLKAITHIAVTVGPGLIGSLLVGFNTAKSLAYALNIPIVPINHIEGHIYSALASFPTNLRIERKYESTNRNNETIEQLNHELKFPILALTVSGGHTSLTLIHDHGKYENVGGTLDDAAGEAFDKAAKLLDLGYPGGPALSRVAEEFRTKSQRSGIILPLPLWQDSSYNFSYSGLKTAVLTLLRKAEKVYQNNPEELDKYKQELVAVFEETAVAHLIDKTLKATKKHGIKSVLLAGGVSANKYLREHLKSELDKIGVDLMMPPMEMTGDNAAMIGLAAYYHVFRGDVKNWNEIKVDSNLKL